MAKVLERMRWREIPIGVTSAFGASRLLMGEIGKGAPGVLITAGIHGDEGPWGAWAIQKLLSSIDENDLRGFLRVVPMANPLAMEADKRNAPVDQLDLNRAFPGDESGSYTERIAHILATAGLEDIDAVIDLHGGGSWCVNAFVFEMDGGRDLSLCFPAPFIVKAPARDVSLTGYAQTRGMTVTAVEVGGRGPGERQWAERITEGLLRALRLIGVVDADLALPPVDPPIAVSGTTVLRPAQGGIFVPALDAAHIGAIVERGALLGRLHHPATFAVLEEFHAPFQETALLLLRPFVAQVEAGAMTYVLAQPVRD
ncbi:MAG: M14 family metallopeptidase [Chloroflexi bacterium]|nr:M14 family metallopeptidase [Chloroflexota bacterium]